MKFRTKLLRVMKLTAFFILLTCLSLSARTSGQTVSYSGKNAKLEQVFSAIEKQTGYGVFYKVGDLKDAKTVNIDLSKVPLTEALERILKDQRLAYSIEGNTIFISPKKAPGSASMINHENIPLTAIDVHGKVTDENGKPVVGAAVQVKGTNKGTTTNETGEFSLVGVDDKATLIISAVNIESREVIVNGRWEINLVTKTKISSLEDVEITAVNTGYQTIPKERATGSFDVINTDLLNRKVSTNILDRLDGIAVGVLFNKNANKTGNDPSISIRGRSTIFANTEPLIVVNNFPYDGDLSNINPNDVESVSILKDAAAASIWGVRAGNGVIVITTKKGKLNQRPQMSFNSNLTFGEKPDLFYQKQLSSSEFIDVEKFLFAQGRFNSLIANKYGVISPVIDILNKNRSGLISNSAADEKINALRLVDEREQRAKYFYRSSLSQQYSLNINGGNASQKYAFAGGYDDNKLSSVGSSFKRYTLALNNTYFLLNNKLELYTGVQFANSISQSAPVYDPKYPYAQVADINGKLLPTVRELSQTYKDTAGSGYLLDWNYYPLEERTAVSKTSITDYKFNLNVSYRIIEGLSITGSYQFSKGISEATTLAPLSSYYTRSLINNFTQINRASNVITRPIPLGDILDSRLDNYKSQFARTQLVFSKKAGAHAFLGIAGFEIRDFTSNSEVLNRKYGYNQTNASEIPVDYFTIFPIYNNVSGSRRIDKYGSQLITFDRLRSFYFNGSYTYLNKYVLSFSARKDESNIFGVSSNLKSVPLWSAGLSWDVNKEKFYPLNYPNLKLRLTYGYNGNVDKTTSAYITARNEAFTNPSGLPFATILNPPNPSLSWEKVAVFNLGFDVSTRNRNLVGSIDFYRKRGEDLIANSPIAPQTGIIQFHGNAADMITNGIDLKLHIQILKGTLNWTSDINYANAIDRITNYKVVQPTVLDYMTSSNTTAINPMEGRPYSALFSFPFAGLDAAGNPQGYLNDKKSTDYLNITGSKDFSSLIYNGSMTPQHFGSIRNTFSWKKIDFSFNIIYKMGYVFRRSSLNNVSLYATDPFYKFPDYADRWQKAGDEMITTVPSLVYLPDPRRDNFYKYSDVLVEKGDHIRLQDVQFAYHFGTSKSKVDFVKNLTLYVYCSNLGILWRANKHNLDPDVFSGSGFPSSKNYTIGLKTNF